MMLSADDLKKRKDYIDQQKAFDTLELTNRFLDAVRERIHDDPASNAKLKESFKQKKNGKVWGDAASMVLISLLYKKDTPSNREKMLSSAFRMVDGLEEHYERAIGRDNLLKLMPEDLKSEASSENYRLYGAKNLSALCNNRTPSVS